MEFRGVRQWRIAEQVSLEVLGVADEGGWGTHTTIGVDMSGTLSQESEGGPPNSEQGGYHIYCPLLTPP